MSEWRKFAGARQPHSPLEASSAIRCSAGSKVIWGLHGVNLNRLGHRDPHYYGTVTLDDIEERIATRAAQYGFGTDFFQTNWSGALTDCIQEISQDPNTAGFVANLGAWTHNDRGLGDTFRDAARPLVEVHLSDIHERARQPGESFRKISVLKNVRTGIVSGIGIDGYDKAVDELAAAIRARETSQKIT